MRDTPKATGVRLATCLAFLLLSITASEASCNLNITIESYSSIRMEWGDITDAASYNISVIPRHDISTTGFTLHIDVTPVQISYLKPDTLYDVKVESANMAWTTQHCTAHTYPAPEKLIVGEEPTPYSAMLFLGSNPRVTQWEIELNFANGTFVEIWNTTSNTFYGFSVTGLVPNTEYIARARASQILGEAVDRTDFGDWTKFTTGMRSLFGRVTLLDIQYESDTPSELQDNITWRIGNASLEKGTFSDLSIIRIRNTSGLATVDYEIKVFESFIASVPDFTISSEGFNESRINNGEATDDDRFFWTSSDVNAAEELACNQTCSNSRGLLEPTIEIRNTLENGKHYLLTYLAESEKEPCGPWTFFLKQENGTGTDGIILSNKFATNTINSIGVVALLNDRASDLLYTRLYEAKNTTSDQMVQYQIFNKDIQSNNVPITELKYTFRDDYNSTILFFPNVKKAVKYEVKSMSGTNAALLQDQIDDSEYLQIHLDNLLANATNGFKIAVTARNHDGGHATTAEIPFNITTTLMTCNESGINEICYKNIDGESFSDCDIGFTRNETMVCTKNRCSSSNCDTNATCSELNSIEYPGFRCTCDAGFTGNGSACNLIYECDVNTNICPLNSTCINIINGYICICDDGFTSNEDNCLDIDECEGSNSCTGNLTCVNAIGTYSCECIGGFTGNEDECLDIDECSDEVKVCDENANCSNTVGSYTCSCNVGYIGNLTHCFEFVYYSETLNATAWQLTTNWPTGISLEISLQNSTSIYSIEACQDADEDIRKMNITSTETIVSSLYPGNLYSVEGRRADNEMILIEDNFTTDKFLPTIPVQVDSTNSSIHVRWDKTYSGIAFSLVLSGENSAPLQEVNTTESSFYATDLKPGNTMEFCMRILYCAIPPGNNTCRTVHTVPSHLENVTVLPTFDSITALWSPVKGSQIYLASLAVMTNKRIGSGNNFPQYKETTGTNLTFESLQPDTEYIFSIAAANEAGNGTYVEIRVTTSAIPEILEMTSTPLQWWWILGGFVMLLSLVIGLIIAHVRVNHWYAELDVTTRKELNSSRCFSCWSAILMVQEADMNDREMDDDIEENGVKLRWFPWRRVFNVSAKQSCNKAENRDENPYDMAHENHQRGCCGWKAIFWIPRESQQDRPTASTAL